MKFPRTAKILGNQSDTAPYAAVFFLLITFVLVAALLPTPGVGLSLVNLPEADNLAGANQPTVAVAIDCSNRLYFADQMIADAAADLKTKLSNAVSRASSPLTLVIQADKTVSYEELLQLSLLARNVGITNALLATLPRPTTGSGTP
jgi:biopolymer transport protein ExbD